MTFRRTPSYEVAKRAVDLLAALVGLVIFGPLILLCALAVKVDSAGPMFCKTERIGRYGRAFQLYKIRVQAVDSDARGSAMAAGGERLTRVGRFLRDTHMHELPQLINLLKGDMSLVGPRPEEPGFVAHYTPEQRQVLSVRPGLTSEATLAYSYEYNPPSPSSDYLDEVLAGKLSVELAYLERRSWRYDLAILARTVGLIFPKQVVEFRRRSNFLRRHVPWLVVDATIVAVGFYLAVGLRFLDTPWDLPAAVAGMRAAILPVVAMYIACNYFFGLHRRAWRYAAAPEVLAIAIPAAVSTFAITSLDLLVGMSHRRPLPLSVALLGGFFTFTGFVSVRYRWRLLGGQKPWRTGARESSHPRLRTLIYGAGESGQALAARLRGQKEGRSYEIVGFLDDDRSKQGLLVHGIEILGNRFDLPRLVEQKKVGLIVLAIANLSGERLRGMLSIAQETSAQIRLAPNVFEWMERPNGTPLLREVEVQDLLGRLPVTLDVPACRGLLSGKVALVTGACGSIGQELCRQICSFGPQSLVMVDNNETGVYDLEIELRTRFPQLNRAVVVGDVTDEQKMNAVFGDVRPDIVFHAAAYKHVPLMEQFPDQAVRVNIGGTWNTLERARQYGAQRFVLVSTDKAVNPTSVMGATKRVAEMLVMRCVENGNGQDPSSRSNDRTLCTAVRFGNVLGSRGSVVPTFAKQIELGGPVTVTHPEMTRYFMDVSEAARLIIQAAALTTGGDIFMLDMGDRIRIDDLARKMIRLRGLRPGIDISIVYTGIRPGEKMHEELAYANEQKQATEHPSIHRSVRIADGAPVFIGKELEQAVGELICLASTGPQKILVDKLLTLSGDGIRASGPGRSSSVMASG